MGVLLTDEEIQELNTKAHRILSCIGCDIIAKAQLKKVALDLGRKCTKTKGRSSFVEVYVQALLKEVEDD